MDLVLQFVHTNFQNPDWKPLGKQVCAVCVESLPFLTRGLEKQRSWRTAPSWRPHIIKLDSVQFFRKHRPTQGPTSEKMRPMVEQSLSHLAAASEGRCKARAPRPCSVSLITSARCCLCSRTIRTSVAHEMCFSQCSASEFRSLRCRTRVWRFARAHGVAKHRIEVFQFVIF